MADYDTALDLIGLIESRAMDDRALDVQLALAFPYEHARECEQRPGNKAGTVVTIYQNGRAGTWIAPNPTTKIEDATTLMDRADVDPDAVFRAALDDMAIEGLPDGRSWRFALPRHIVVATLRAVVARLEIAEAA